MNRLHRRLRKIEALTAKRLHAEKRPSAFELALQSMSVEDLTLLRDDIEFRRDGREADLTDLHRAASARLEEKMACLEATGTSDLVRSGIIPVSTIHAW